MTTQVRLLNIAITYFLLIVVIPLSAQNYVENEIIIKFNSYAPLEDVVEMTEDIAPVQITELVSIKAQAWEVPSLVIIDGEELNGTEELIAFLSEDPNVEYVQHNYLYELLLSPDDPELPSQWAMNNTGQTGGTDDADIDAIEGWDIQSESPDIVVGVVDTGIDWGHPDLIDNIFQNLQEDVDGDGHVLEWDGNQWIFDPGDENGIDDDNNGYIDDFVGWDFSDNDNNPGDYHGHGTHVAGTIGAKGDNSIGVVGVTHNVQLMAAKIFPIASDANIVDAIKYMTSMKVDISNNSWGCVVPGGCYSQAVSDAIANAAYVDHVFVAAAGNDNGNDNDVLPHYPSSYAHNNIIAVASTTHTDALSSFSNVGLNSVDIAAPGSSILSTDLNGSYSYKNGTSMATPHVTGALSLLKNQMPDATIADLKIQLLSTVDVKAPLVNSCVAGGRLNICKMLGGCIDEEPSCSYSDSLALVALYNSTNGADWVNTWDLSAPMSTWFGVYLNAEGCVTCLDLDGHNNCTNQPEMGGNNLTGVLSPEIGQLSALENIFLGENLIGGEIPQQIGNLYNLQQLVFTNNEFIGEIPQSMMSLTGLQTLSLAENNLTGLMPNSIDNLNQLEHLSVSYNQLSGSLPQSIGNLTNLTSLNIHGNDFAGSIPGSLGNLTNLNSLHAYDNEFTGCFAEDLASLCGANIYFYDNPGLPGGGDFPAFCADGTGMCTPPPIEEGCAYSDSLALVELFYAANGSNWINTWDLDQPMNTWHGITLNEEGCVSLIQLQSNNLTGVIAPEIGNLSELVYLKMSYNSLTGSIPVEIASLDKLEFLGLFHNQLSGTIPSELGNLNALEIFSINSNQISGSIPTSLGSLENLVTLNLSHNELTGAIPSEIGELTNLYSLLLDFNELTGNIPSSLGNLINLVIFELKFNDLSGEIPASLGSLNNLSYFSVKSNDLSGCFPPELMTLCAINAEFLYNSDLPGGGDFPAFCADGTGSCNGDIPTNVWPGDANFDGLVDYLDVFTLGYKEGKNGTSRVDQSIGWYAHPSGEWEDDTPDGIDAKHADCDGNGTVMIDADVLAVVENYASTHNEIGMVEIASSNLIVTPVISNIAYIDEAYHITYQVELNDISGDISEMYGIGFSLNTGSLSGEISVNTNGSLLGDDDDLFVFTQQLPSGKTDVVLVRTDGVQATISSENSTIASFIFIEDNIPTDGSVFLSLEGTTITDNQGNYTGAASQSVQTYLSQEYVIDANNDNNNVLAMTITTTPSDCNGGSAQITPIGGLAPYSFHWEDGITNSTRTNLSPGLKSVTISDALDNSIEAEVEITGTAPIAISVEVEPVLNFSDGSITINSIEGGVGELLIEWSNGQTGTMATNLSKGKYWLTITDEAECQFITDIKVNNSTIDNVMFVAQDNEEVYESIIASRTSLEENQECAIYPNPVTDRLTISLNLKGRDSKQIKWSIYDNLGRLISERSVKNEEERSNIIIAEDVSGLRSGLYFINLALGNNQFWTQTFVKE